MVSGLDVPKRSIDVWVDYHYISLYLCIYIYISYIHCYQYYHHYYHSHSSPLSSNPAIHPLPTIPKKQGIHRCHPRLRLTPAVSSRNQWLPSRPARRSHHATAPPGEPSRLRTCANKRRHLGGSQAPANFATEKSTKKGGLSYKKVDF